MTDPNAVLSRMLALAVHEFRTPVSVASGYLRMLETEQAGPLSGKQRKIVEEAERACKRLGALVNEMSDLVKLMSPDAPLARQELDLDALVAEVASSMHEGADRGVRLDVRAAERSATVTGDRARIAAALAALLHSALRERGTPGAIVAQCAVVQDSDTAWAVVAIGDAALVPALLERHRNPPVFNEWLGGTGLALPLARRIIEAHGGAVWSADGTESRAASGLRLPVRNRIEDDHRG